MAEKLQNIKRRIRSVTSTEKITNAMKLVSAARLRQATNTLRFVRANLEETRKMFGGVLAEDREQYRPYFTAAESGKTLFVVFSSSRGLCGSFNVMIEQELDRIHREEGQNALFLTVGEKADDYLDYRNIPRIDAGVRILDEMTFQDTMRIADDIVARYDRGEFVRAELVYAAYINSLVSEITHEALLPLDREKMLENAGAHPAHPEVENADVADQFARTLLRQYLALYLYAKKAESLVSEHSARRNAMNNATDNAEDMLQKLSLEYNRVRQTAITNEIIEIIAGANAQQ